MVSRKKCLLVFFISSDQSYGLYNFQANNSVRHNITEQTNKEIHDPAFDLKLTWSSAVAAFQIQRVFNTWEQNKFSGLALSYGDVTSGIFW